MENLKAKLSWIYFFLLRAAWTRSEQRKVDPERDPDHHFSRPRAPLEGAGAQPERSPHTH